MSEFVWQDEYLLGNPLVDEQHKHLFALANKLVRSPSKAALSRKCDVFV